MISGDHDDDDETRLAALNDPTVDVKVEVDSWIYNVDRGGISISKVRQLSDTDTGADPGPSPGADPSPDPAVTEVEKRLSNQDNIRHLCKTWDA